MGGRAGALIALVAMLAAMSCGDPIVVLGDAPGIARVVAGMGNKPGTAIDSLATRSRLTSPTALAFDEGTGFLFFADRGSTVSQDGVTRPVGRLFTVRSDGRITMLIDRGGCAGDVCLESPHSLILAPGGDLYVSDQIGHRILRFRPGAGILEPVTGDGRRGHTPDGQPAAGARVDSPTGLAWVNGRLVFAERGGHRIRSIEADGTLGTVAGTGVRGFAGDGGAAAQASLDTPGGISAHGNSLFIADRDNQRVRHVDLSSGRITTLAGTGTAGFGGDGGPASEGRLDRPVAVAVTPDGTTLFITDFGNNRVRSVDLDSGAISTFAGTGDQTFVEGPRQAGDVSLLRPAGLATTGAGFLFIADAGHSVVWRVTLRF